MSMENLRKNILLVPNTVSLRKVDGTLMRPLNFFIYLKKKKTWSKLNLPFLKGWDWGTIWAAFSWPLLILGSFSDALVRHVFNSAFYMGYQTGRDSLSLGGGSCRQDPLLLQPAAHSGFIPLRSSLFVASCFTSYNFSQNSFFIPIGKRWKGPRTANSMSSVLKKWCSPQRRLLLCFLGLIWIMWHAWHEGGACPVSLCQEAGFSVSG